MTEEEKFIEGRFFKNLVLVYYALPFDGYSFPQGFS